ncbi:hypothetical protein F5883DRAFT_499962 [Diaporthe sp. PMI_573]|nr:hypothetical protein F5883DRAFT_499962 [Diaporthaceae sp. PMI_573]
MSIGDALPAASAPVALPARTITVTKGNIYQIVNCQLHTAPSPAADYGDPASRYRELTLAHRLPQRPNEEEVSDFCFDLYWEVLAPFSDVIVMFVAWLGPLRTAHILRRWARSPFAASRFSPHIVIVTEDEDPQFTGILDTFTENAKGKLRVSNVIRRSKLPSVISSLAEQSNEARTELELNFAYQHRFFLIQTSLQYFCDNLPLLDFVTASRLPNPVPLSAEFHLQKAVIAFDPRIPQLTGPIASALALDAFPPGMHYFRPKDVFHTIYKPVIGQLRIALATETFLSQVESTFTTLILKNRKHNLKAATSHAHRVRLIGSAAAGIDLTGTCVFCLLRRPIFTLACQHQLCPCCIIASGAASQNPICSLSTCPWCGKANARLFSLQPPTAGSRILDLGPSSDLTQTCAFLKDIQRNTITALPLRDYFDVVRCDGICGLLLVLSLFVEEWCLDGPISDTHL